MADYVKVYHDMTEISVEDTKEKEADRPKEVLIAVLLLIVNAMVGLAAAAFGLAWYEDALSALGFIVAVVALWVARGLWNVENEMWNYAIILNLIGIVLYAFSFLWLEGIILCILTLVYLNIPAVKEYFMQ